MQPFEVAGDNVLQVFMRLEVLVVLLATILLANNETSGEGGLSLLIISTHGMHSIALYSRLVSLTFLFVVFIFVAFVVLICDAERSERPARSTAKVSADISLEGAPAVCNQTELLSRVCKSHNRLTPSRTQGRLIQETDVILEKDMIGVGSLGSVYRANFHGSAVACKVICYAVDKTTMVNDLFSEIGKMTKFHQCVCASHDTKACTTPRNEPFRTRPPPQSQCSHDPWNHQ